MLIKQEIERLRSESSEEYSSEDSHSNTSKHYINDDDNETIGYTLKHDYKASIDSEDEYENTEDSSTTIIPQEDLQQASSHQDSSSSGKDKFYLEKRVVYSYIGYRTTVP